MDPTPMDRSCRIFTSTSSAVSPAQKCAKKVLRTIPSVSREPSTLPDRPSSCWECCTNQPHEHSLNTNHALNRAKLSSCANAVFTSDKSITGPLTGSLIDSLTGPAFPLDNSRGLPAILLVPVWLQRECPSSPSSRVERIAAETPGRNIPGKVGVTEEVHLIKEGANDTAEKRNILLSRTREPTFYRFSKKKEKEKKKGPKKKKKKEKKKKKKKKKKKN